METILDVVEATLVFVLLLNTIFAIWSFRALKKLLRDWQQRAPSDNFLMEHLIETKSSIRLIYAMITVVAITLTLVGWNQLDQIKKDMTKDILKQTQVSLDSAKLNVNAIDSLLSISRAKYGEIDTLYKVARANQRLFVVTRFEVPKHDTERPYTQLKTIDGRPIPKFNQQPAVVWRVYPRSKEITDLTITVSTTKDNIRFEDVNVEGLLVDLWIYGK